MRSKITPVLFIVLVLALVTGVFSATSYAAEPKVGFIDIKNAVAGTNEFKRQKSKFDSEFEKQQKIIVEREGLVKNLFEELNKQGFVLSPELKKQKEETFVAQKKSLERYVQDKNEEFARREKEITLKITEQMLGVLNTIGKERNFTLIVEKSATFYFDNALDITDLAIKAYNKAHR